VGVGQPQQSVGRAGGVPLLLEGGELAPGEVGRPLQVAEQVLDQLGEGQVPVAGRRPSGRQAQEGPAEQRWTVPAEVDVIGAVHGQVEALQAAAERHRSAVVRRLRVPLVQRRVE
jgi:hypothetical protein